jgi:hypothetical protein
MEGRRSGRLWTRNRIGRLRVKRSVGGRKKSPNLKRWRMSWCKIETLGYWE